MTEPARDRFLRLDAYRVQREWARYEGTPQRDLFRELRRRFVARHGGGDGPVADLGSGPGRFADDLGPARAPRVLVDLSGEALRDARDRRRPLRRSRGAWHFVRGDAHRPPLARRRWGTVALLGNVAGFAGASSAEILQRSMELLAPGGILIVEAVAGPGEHAAYLRRLPPTAAARALRAPARWLDGRIASEGFVPEPSRREEEDETFVRWDPDRLGQLLTASGGRVLETMAVAPLTGPDAERIAVVARDPKDWDRLLRTEERWGTRPARCAAAAAYLVAARRDGSPGPVVGRPSGGPPGGRPATTK